MHPGPGIQANEIIFLKLIVFYFILFLSIFLASRYFNYTTSNVSSSELALKQTTQTYLLLSYLCIYVLRTRSTKIVKQLHVWRTLCYLKVDLIKICVPPPPPSAVQCNTPESRETDRAKYSCLCMPHTLISSHHVNVPC